jgi:hypothetical protein
MLACFKNKSREFPFSLFSLSVLACCSFFGVAFANSRWDYLWKENVLVPETGRENVFSWPQEEFEQRKENGIRHAFNYPVNTTEMILPYEFVANYFGGERKNPLIFFFQNIIKNISKIKAWEDVERTLDLSIYPSNLVNLSPKIAKFPQVRMGTSLVKYTGGGEGITFGCMACHGGSLFGRAVVGLANKVPRANEFFLQGDKVIHSVPIETIGKVLKLSSDDTNTLKRLERASSAVGGKQPKVLGLDTSLAQLGLSLSKRKKNDYADFDENLEKNPAPNLLDNYVADSKPAPWWNVKYKNKWLLDGSIVSGNPIFTNILWNEIGRGANLRKLETWLEENEDTYLDLTTAVFATKSPRFEDFFDIQNFDLNAAKQGEKVFVNNCAKCHGTYEKAWSSANASQMNSKKNLIQTVQVRYHENTPVIDVGTDKQRAIGMSGFSENLNGLLLSQKIETLIRVQSGYVPPPLEGIWARWPYFHNSSVPSLCAVLTKASERPKTFYVGAAVEASTDFDAQCNGFPKIVPKAWRKNSYQLFDTTQSGLKNSGHDEGIFLMNSKELLSDAEKKNLILFLQTL